jgi:hypothetical protein
MLVVPNIEASHSTFMTGTTYRIRYHWKPTTSKANILVNHEEETLSGVKRHRNPQDMG